MIQLGAKLTLPLKLIDEELLPKLYSRYCYKGSMCSKCEFLSDRVTNPLKPVYDTCEDCDGFEGRYKFYKIIEIKGKEHVTLPLGDRKKILQIFPKYKLYQSKGRIVDTRPRTKIHKAIKFVGKPYDYQMEAVEKLKKRKYGILESKPRTGKCQVAGTLVRTAKGLEFIEKLVGAIPYDISTPKILSVATKDGVQSTSHVYKSKSNTIKLITEHGFSVEGTPEHKMWVKSSKGLDWKCLKDVGESDSLILDVNNLNWGELSYDGETQWIQDLATLIKAEYTELPNKVFTNRAVAELLIGFLLKGTLLDIHSSKNESQIQVLLLNLGVLSVRT